MRNLLLCAVLAVAACGGKTKPAATDSTAGAGSAAATGSNAGAGSADPCCCAGPEGPADFADPRACAARGGECVMVTGNCMDNGMPDN